MEVGDKSNSSLRRLENSIRLPKKHLGYYAHHHPLVLCNHDDHQNQNDGTSTTKSCSWCNLLIHESTTSFFMCTECIPNFSLHKSCAETPQEIFHPLHPYHPLKYSPNQSHYLTQICCNICITTIWGPTYGCAECDFTVHIQCAQIPLEIHHPLHPPHPLYLINLPKPTSCNACDIVMFSLSGCYGFRCLECNFNLDIFCNTLKPNIDVGKVNHVHKLTLFEDMGGNQLVCDTCDVPISVLPFVRCVEYCRLSYHVHCVFPMKIKTRNHVHSLMVNIISDNIVSPDDDDDNDDGDNHEVCDDGIESYCDACEEVRDPKETVYSCLECEYVAHVGCAFSEISQ